MATIFERVRSVVAAVLELDEAEEAAIDPSMSFVDDLGCDSLQVVEVIMGLEAEFSEPGREFLITEEDANRAVTIQKAIEFLRRQGFRDIQL